MPSINLTEFRGVNKFLAPHLLKPTEAADTDSCSFDLGAIAGLTGIAALAPAVTVTAGTISLYKFNGGWESSTAARYWAEDNGILYWADGGIPQKKNSAGAQVRLGIVAPPQPTCAINSSTTAPNYPPTTGQQYVVTYYSSTWGGESAPCALVTANNYRGTLQQSITATDTSIVIAGFPSANPPSSGKFKIDSEIITYTGITGAGPWTLTGVTRGTNGTTAAAHTAPTVFYYYFDSVSFTGLTASSDAQVTDKRIYRLVSGTYGRVTSVANATTTYTDSTADADLPTLTGTPLTASTNDAPGNADWICGPFNGMLVIGQGKTVSWSRVGRYDAFPAVANTMTFKTPVSVGVVWGGFVTLLTQEGPYTLSGSDDTSLAKYKAQSSHGCLSGRTAAVSPMGVLYVSPEGVVLFDGRTTQVLTAETFPAWYFSGMVSPRAAYHNGRYILCHDGINIPGGGTLAAGCIIGDFRFGDPYWTVSTTITAAALHRSDVDQALYTVNGTSVGQWETGTGASWTWLSPVFSPGQLGVGKVFHMLRVNCTGSVTPKVYIDGGTAITLPAISNASVQKMVRMRFGPKRGVRAQIALSGTGTVYGVEMDYSEQGANG